MGERFGSVRISNSTSLCVGGITNAEAGQAREQGMEIDGFGYYLFLFSEADPKEPIEIIAKVSRCRGGGKGGSPFPCWWGQPS